jgi:DNA-binding PadR family transcriptional regulator
MTAEHSDLGAYLPLSPTTFQILLALVGTERHGYSILHEIARSTHGSMRLGTGALYRALHQLLAAGFIAETEERPDPALDDQRRRYYRLTDLGQRVASAEALRLASLVAQAQAKAIIPDGGAGQPGGALGGTS